MNKKGFTLIELLAVIIILGILMIIAIPSVTKYINDSRKSSYIDTARELIGAARNFVNDGKLEMYDTDTTYYLDQECIKTENESRSPYGKFTKAYVIINYTGTGYNYYWISVDDSKQGISKITPLDKLDIDLIESDLDDGDIINTLGVNGRHKYMVIDKSTKCDKGTISDVSKIEIINGRRIEDVPVSSEWGPGPHTFGSTLTWIADTSEYEQYNYIVQWQVLYESNGEWEDIDGANSTRYTYIVDSSNFMYHWRPVIIIFDE